MIGTRLSQRTLRRISVHFPILYLTTHLLVTLLTNPPSPTLTPNPLHHLPPSTCRLLKILCASEVEGGEARVTRARHMLALVHPPAQTELSAISATQVTRRTLIRRKKKQLPMWRHRAFRGEEARPCDGKCSAVKVGCFRDLNVGEFMCIWPSSLSTSQIFHRDTSGRCRPRIS